MSRMAKHVFYSTFLTDYDRTYETTSFLASNYPLAVRDFVSSDTRRL